MTTTPSGVERLRTALSAAWCGAPATAACPRDETILAASGGDLSAREFEHVLDHVSGCAACQRSWALAVELTSRSEDRCVPIDNVDRSTAGALPDRWTSIWIAPLAAAAVLVVAAGGLWATRRGMTAGAAYEATRAPAAPAMVSFTPAAVPRTAATLTWSELPDDPRYDIVVTTEGLDAVADGRELVEPRFVIPVAALEQYPSGTVLLWRVEARLASGLVQRSATHRTVLE